MNNIQYNFLFSFICLQLENNLGSGAYQKIARATSSYKEDDDYIEYRDTLREIFNHAGQSTFMLRGMTLLFKPDHRPHFDAYVDQLETE